MKTPNKIINFLFNFKGGEICLWQQVNRSIVFLKSLEIPASLCLLLPDDEHLLYLDFADYSLKIFNHVSSKVERVILGFKENIAGLFGFSSGKNIITLGKDGTARIWAVSTGEEVKWIFNDPEWQFVCAALSKSDKYIYFLLKPQTDGEYEAMKLVSVEISSGKIQEKHLNSRDFASSRMMADKFDENVVYVTKQNQLLKYDREDDELRTLNEAGRNILEATISSGGELILMCDEDHKIIAYSLKNQRVMMSLKVNQKIDSIVASVDNFSFFTLHLDQNFSELKLWNYKALMESGLPSATYCRDLSKTEFETLNSTKYGDSIIIRGKKAIGSRSLIKIVNLSSSLKSRIEQRNLDISRFSTFDKFDKLSYASFSATGRALGVNKENQFCLFQFEGGELSMKHLLIDQSLVVNSQNYKITPDGLKMVFQIPAELESDSAFLFWNEETMEKETFTMKGSAVSDFELSRHGEYIVLLSKLGLSENIIRVFSVESSSVSRKILLPNGHINKFVISQCLPYKILTGGTDGVIRIYDMGTGGLERKISAFNAPISCLITSPDQRRIIASSSESECVKEFCEETGFEMSIRRGNHIGCQIATNSDSTKLITCGGVNNSLSILDRISPCSLLKVKWCLKLLQDCSNTQSLIRETPRSLWENVSFMYSIYPMDMTILHYLIYAEDYNQFENLLTVCEAHNVFLNQKKDIFLKTPLQILLNKEESGVIFAKRLLKHIKKGLASASKGLNTQISSEDLEKIIEMELTDLSELLNLLLVTLIRVPDLEAYLTQEKNKGRKASSIETDDSIGVPVFRHNRNILITAHTTLLPNLDMLAKFHKQLDLNEVSRPVEIRVLDVEGIGLVSNKFIKTVLKSFPPNHTLYDSPVFAMIVTFKWRLFAKKYFLMQGAFSAFFALLYVINVIYVLPLRTEIPDEMNSSKGFSIFLDLVLFIFYLIFLAWEGFQLRSLGISVYLRKLLNFWGFINCIFLILMLPAIFIDLGHAAGHTPDKDVKAFHSVTLFFLWIKLLGIMRGVEGGSFMIRSLAHIFLELKYFWFILFAICVGFSFCAYIVQDAYRVDLFDSFRAVYNMMLGDFERYEALQTPHNSGILWLVLMFTTVLLTIVMLNLVTAFIIELYEKENHSEKSGNIYDKALLVRDIEDIIPQREINKLKTQGKDRPYLFVAAVESLVTQEKERTAERMEKKIKSIEEGLESLKDSIAEIDISLKLQKRKKI